MKSRSIIPIIGLALALIAMFTALPAQAQTTTSVADLELDHLYSTSAMKFRWSTISGEYESQFQINGGGITNVWTTVSISSVQYSFGKTEIVTSALSSDPASLSGNTVNCRVRVTVCTEQGADGCVTSYKSDWAYVDVEFD